MFGKTQHDSAVDAVTAATDDSIDDNCARLIYETDERSFSIEFAAVENPNGWHYNVAGYSGDIDHQDVIDAVSLDIIEAGRGYVLLESKATSTGDVLKEIGSLTVCLGADPSKRTAAKTFRMMDGSLLDNLKSLLGIEDD